MLQSQWTKVDDDAGERYALWSTLLHLGVESLTVGVESCEEPVPIGDRALVESFGRPSMGGAAEHA